MKKLLFITIAILLSSSVFGQQKICDSIYIDSLTIKDGKLGWLAKSITTGTIASQINYPEFVLIGTKKDTLTKKKAETFIIPYTNWNYRLTLLSEDKLPDTAFLHLNDRFGNGNIHCEFPIDIKNLKRILPQQKICDSIYIDSLAIKDGNFNFVSRNDSKTQINYPKFDLLSTSGDTLTNLFSSTYIIPEYNWTYYAQIIELVQLPNQAVLHLNSKLINSVHCEYPLDLIQVNKEQNLKFCDSIYLDSISIKADRMSFVARNDGKTFIHHPLFILTTTDLDTLAEFFGAIYGLPYYNSTYVAEGLTNISLLDSAIIHLNDGLGKGNLHCEFPFDIKKVITTVEKHKNLIINSLPNPIEHNFKIDLNQKVDGTISVINVSGEQVYKSNINDNSVKVSLDKNIKAGVYLISIQSNEEGNVLLEKVILE